MEISQIFSRSRVSDSTPSQVGESIHYGKSLSEALNDAINLLRKASPRDIIWEVDDTCVPALFVQDPEKQVLLYVGFPSVENSSPPFNAIIESGLQRFIVCNFAEDLIILPYELRSQIYCLGNEIERHVIHGLQKALGEFGCRLMGIERDFAGFDDDDDLMTTTAYVQEKDLICAPVDSEVAVKEKSGMDRGGDQDINLALVQKKRTWQLLADFFVTLLKRLSGSAFVDKEQSPEEEQMRGDDSSRLSKYDVVKQCFQDFTEGSLGDYFFEARKNININLRNILEDQVWFEYVGGKAFKCQFGCVEIIIEQIEGQREAIGEPVVVYSIHARYGPYTLGYQTSPIGIVPNDDRRLDFPLCVLYNRLCRLSLEKSIKPANQNLQNPSSGESLQE